MIIRKHMVKSSLVLLLILVHYIIPLKSVNDYHDWNQARETASGSFNPF